MAGETAEDGALDDALALDIKLELDVIGHRRGDTQRAVEVAALEFSRGARGGHGGVEEGLIRIHGMISRRCFAAAWN